MCTMILKKLKSTFNKPIFAYLSLVGGFLVQLTLGSVYTYGNMAPYMLEYMKNNTNPRNKINAGNSMWIFGLSVFGLGATMSFGGFMVPKIGTIATVLSGSWMMSFGVIVTYWTINTHVAFIAVTYGLIMGLGVGIAYGTIISIPSEWFPNSKGLVTGIVVAGFGFAPITLDFIQSYYINPNITQVNIHDTSKVRSSFLLMGSIYAGLQLIGSIMIRRPKVQIVNAKESEESTIIFEYIEKKCYQVEIKTKPVGLIFEKDFWILWLTYTLNSCVAILILSLHKVFGGKLNLTDLFLTVSTAFGAAFNGFGRIIWGHLIDRISYKKLMTILTLSMSLMLGTFYLCTFAGDIEKKSDISRCIMYFIWIIILHFLLSGNFSIFPVICNQNFGMENAVLNYGVLFTAYALAGIITSSTTTYMFFESVGVEAYLAPFSVGCGLSLFSACVTQIYRGRPILRQCEN